MASSPVSNSPTRGRAEGTTPNEIQATPLLKYTGTTLEEEEGEEEEGEEGSDVGTPELKPEGLEALRKLQAPIYPVILIGDGRAGKSFLATRVMRHKVRFKDDNTAKAVTNGIDIGIMPMPQGRKGSLLVLDCEGGNNATAPIRTLVNVFGMLVGTLIVFVTANALQESTLHYIAATIAKRELIGDEGGEFPLPPQKLMMVVNKTDIPRSDLKESWRGIFEKKKKSSGAENGRATLRETVSGKFPNTSVIGISNALDKDKFEKDKEDLIGEVLKDVKPLTMNAEELSIQLDGIRLAELLEKFTKRIKNEKEVEFPDMYKFVVFNGFLMPIVEQLDKQFQDTLEKIENFDPELDKKDHRVDFEVTLSFPSSKKIGYDGRGVVVADETVEMQSEPGHYIIREGSQIKTINGTPFSKDVMDREEKSGNDYKITFQVGILRRFENRTSHIANKSYIKEARTQLEQRMNHDWKVHTRRNEEEGNKICERRKQTQIVAVPDQFETKHACFGLREIRHQILETQQREEVSYYRDPGVFEVPSGASWVSVSGSWHPSAVPEDPTDSCRSRCTIS